MGTTERSRAKRGRTGEIGRAFQVLASWVDRAAHSLWAAAATAGGVE
jgi:hypothetical protein